MTPSNLPKIPELRIAIYGLPIAGQQFLSLLLAAGVTRVYLSDNELASSNDFLRPTSTNTVSGLKRSKSVAIAAAELYPRFRLLRKDESIDCVVVFTSGALPASSTAYYLASGLTHLVVQYSSNQSDISVLTVPGETSCASCWKLTELTEIKELDKEPLEKRIIESLVGRNPSIQSAIQPLALAISTAAFAFSQLANYYATSAVQQRHVLTSSEENHLSVATQRAEFHPDCNCRETASLLTDWNTAAVEAL